MFQRVRIRLTALTLAIVLILYTLLAVSVYSIAGHVVYQTIDNRLAESAHSLVVEGPSASLAGLPAGVFGAVYTQQRVVSKVPANLQQPLEQFIRMNGVRRPWRATWSPTGQPEFRVLFRPLDRSSTPAFVVLITDIARERAVLSHLLDVMLWVGGAGFVVAALGGFLLAERALRPVHRAWQRQLEFVADASHELRTPLSVIQSNLGVVLAHTDQSVTENLEWLDNAHSEARRLTKLVQDLLTLARSDTQATSLQKERLSLTELAQHVTDLFDAVVAAKGLVLEGDLNEEVQVVGDRDRLHQLLVILVDNACKYTPSGGTVRIGIKQTKSLAVVEIADSGVGIDKEELPRVFDRFYQGDTARARNDSRGVGLGLAIAKWIVEAHRGKISAASMVGRGTTFTVQLPLESSR